MGGKGKCRRSCRRPCGGRRDFKRVGFIMMVFGIVTICAFFLPIKAWIVLLGCLLIYCGCKLLH